MQEAVFFVLWRRTEFLSQNFIYKSNRETTSLLILIFCAVDQLLSYFYQVWKDVDGVLTCDPNIHPKAKPVPYLTFDEAAELAYFGAQVCVVIH